MTRTQVNPIFWPGYLLGTGYRGFGLASSFELAIFLALAIN
jgi:hypothetical protein